MIRPRGDQFQAAALLAVFFTGLLGWAATRRSDPDFVGQDGLTALQRATATGDHEAMARLLEAGADPDASASREVPRWVRPRGRRSPWGSWQPDPVSPLETAASRHDTRGLRLLLEAGAERDAHVLRRLALMSDCHECLRLTIEAGAELTLKGQSDCPALGQAVGSLHPEAARALLEAGADPNATHFRGGSLLHVLLDNCVHPRWQKWSARAGDEDQPQRLLLLRLLLAHGALADQRQGLLQVLPYDRARWRCGDPEVAAIFEAAGRTLSDGPDGRLRVAARTHDLAELEAALLQGANPSQQLQNGQTLEQWLRGQGPPGRPLAERLAQAAAAP